jgi:hypothetical protein
MMRPFATFLLSLIGSVSALPQEALPIHVRFAFGTTAVNSRFRDKSKEDVEQQITARLATACSDALSPWRCDAGVAAGPAKIDVNVQVRRDKWYLRTTLTPQPTPDLKGEWNDQQIFTGEELIASGGLPMDDGWRAPIERAFAQLIDQKEQTGKELFASLKQVAPLGKNAVPVPLDASHPLPGAVLPLRWESYQRMANCRVRIYYRGRSGELISIVSSGSGGPMDFTPEAPQFKGVWVLHDTYQVGSRPPEPIAAHVQELSDLTVIEFHLEDPGTIPPGLSIAP